MSDLQDTTIPPAPQNVTTYIDHRLTLVGLLAHSSEYFGRAFGNPAWAEVDGIVELDEDEPEILQRFHNFIYTGRLTDNVRLTPHIGYVVKWKSKSLQLSAGGRELDEVSVEIKTRDDAAPLSFDVLLKLLEFADMRIVPTLTDTAVTMIGRKVLTESHIPVSLIGSATEMAPRMNRLTAFVFELIVLAVNRNNFAAHNATLPQQFLAARAKAQLERLDEMKDQARTGPRTETTERIMCYLQDHCLGSVYNVGRCWEFYRK